MKSALSLSLVFIAVNAAVAVSSLPMYEPFPTSYGNGTLMGAGATTTVWDFGNSGTSLGAIVTNSAALAHVGLVGSNSHGLLITGTPSATRNRAASFTAQTFGAGNPVLYASFLVNIQTPPVGSANRLFAGFSSTGSGTSLSGVCGVWVDSAGQLFISKNSSSTPATTNTAALSAGAHLVVMRYQWNAGVSDDTVSLWLDPGTLGAAEGSVPSPDLATASGADLAALQSFAIFHPATASLAATLQVDEIRVGTNWAQVTPPDGSTPVVTNNVPVITQGFFAPGGLVLRGTNGPAGGAYRVLSAATVVTPMNSWSVIATNQFNGSGNFDVTNPVVPGELARFYRLILGGDTTPTLIAPTLTLQPTNQTAGAGQNVTFNSVATGSPTLAYQWFFNSSNVVAGATSATLLVTNVNAADAGNYTVRVTNGAGSVTSTVATLTVQTPPSITTQPASQNVLISNSVTFSVIAAGDAPLRYQWYFNTNTTLVAATNASYFISTALTNHAGSFSVIVTNAFGAVTSSIATLMVNQPSTNTADFNLYGFGAPATGSGQVAETDPNYRKVYTPGDFRLALANNSTKVIEIMNDLNLGWNEIGATNQTGAFRANATASLHPVLIASGVTLIDIQNKNNITIFSANGATIRHAEFNVKRSNNILIRNLKFDELWEWDEATKGDYDSKDWDFITIGDGDSCTNVWIDHCDFTKSYDGTVDIKGGANQVTISWCRFLGDDGGPNSFVRQQFQYLETNGVAESMFDFLRANGFSIDDLVTIARSQKKGHLAGPTEFAADNADIKLTLHHNYYYNFQDRMPRLRGGNAHVYNVYANNTEALAAKNLRNAKVAAISGGLGSYKFDVTLNGAIATEDGAVLVEKCHIVDTTSPLRNNQVDANNASYTGKIRAEDTIYTLNGSTFRGNTEDVGSPLVPVPAPFKPFSWNGFTNLPYPYPVNDPSIIAASITNNAGQGVIFWSKANWFKTTY